MNICIQRLKGVGSFTRDILLGGAVWYCTLPIDDKIKQVAYAAIIGTLVAAPFGMRHAATNSVSSALRLAMPIGYKVGLVVYISECAFAVGNAFLKGRTQVA